MCIATVILGLLWWTTLLWRAIQSPSMCWLGMVCNLGLDAQHAQECFHVGYPCIGHNGIITIVRFSC